MLTPEEESFVQGIELAKDWWMPIKEEDYKRYLELTSREASEE